MSRLPDFLIIGAMKCATSTLHEQLAAQPGVFMSTPKEISFFSDDSVYAQGIDWYKAHFGQVPPHTHCGESSTHYTKLPTFPQTVTRIKQHLPHARFIYLMRHPIDRLISQYIHQWTEREITSPLTEAIDRHPELIAYSRYAMQLQPFFDFFGREQTLPVFLPRLRLAPQAELERIGRFIGYSDVPQWSVTLGRENVSKKRMRNSLLRDKLVYAPGLRWIRKRFVPQSLRDRLKSLWTMRQRPQLSPQQEQRLTAVFNEDLSLLGKWLGRQLNCANFEIVTAEAHVDWVNRPN